MPLKVFRKICQEGFSYVKRTAPVYLERATEIEIVR